MVRAGSIITPIVITGIPIITPLAARPLIITVRIVVHPCSPLGNDVLTVPSYADAYLMGVLSSYEKNELL
ncbi:hypothetical protein MU1_41440 [Paenibacillus glycanilyticus]|uniref:Uncharacterized protein n=1 Tax=Paenibacillus glycanilyticus TaxID=126569 RepID=A0ABQ6GKB2_9BACL|nr:hypothetical protein MU1_41440 [Paenibacillus glycanilyticus]